VRQLKHALDETPEYFPVAQAPVTAVSPVVAQYDPAGHSKHAVEPVEAWNDPAAQTAVTALKPLLAQKDPEGHAMQLDDPAFV